ncbi:MAG: 2-oxo acid dehydrogenase subunit E2 [Clostridia bacterium]|nr:2-oxo acid dehydrogenase subunit E2 [Clostridia bacterium]
MANAVIMPKAGITVESCIIGAWEKKVGDAVKVGDILFTYETDKASFECESTEEGTLLEIFFGDGEEVPCLVNVCAVGAPGEDCSALRPDGAVAEAPEVVAEPAPEAPVAEAAPVVAEVTAVAGEKSAVSPRAKKLAERAGVDAALATPTGPNGRIIERDVRNLIDNPVVISTPVAEAAPVAAAAPDTEYEDVKFSGIRRAIAKSMMTSLSTIAQLTHNTSFDASSILAYRKQLKASEGDCAGITLGDIVLYAVSRTLKNYPDLNANMLDDSTIRHFKHVNLGVAVDTPRGLMVPTIFHADEKSLLEISREVKELAAACREGNISPDKLTGASFTVSNLGNLGVESFTPVINPPQTGILGVCGTIDRVKKGKDGEIAIYPAMGLSLTYDHRAVDGTPAARFQKELCQNLENFTVLLAK